MLNLLNSDSLLSLILPNQLKQDLFINSDETGLSPVPEVPGGTKRFIFLPPNGYICTAGIVGNHEPQILA